MVCNEFRNLMFERLGGELLPHQEAACVEHEQTCAICRAELAQFKWVESRLRAGWPSEDPTPVSVLLPHNLQQPAAHNWFDVASVWFARASAAVVMACLVALLLLRPSIELGRGSLHVAYGHDAARPEAQVTVTQDQLKALVQAEVNEEMSRMQPAALITPQATSPDKQVSGKSSEEAQRINQVAFQMQQLDRSQRVLWQQVQQQELNMAGLWRMSVGNVRPASLSR